METVQTHWHMDKALDWAYIAQRLQAQNLPKQAETYQGYATALVEETTILTPEIVKNVY